MNNNPLHSPTARGEQFCIGDYLPYLTPSEKEKGKYICPICEGHNLSISANKTKYNCWDCQETKKIAYKLRELNGEFNGDKKPLPVTGQKLDSQYSNNSSKSSQVSREKLTTSMDVLAFLREKYDEGRLQYNLRTKEIEIDDYPISLDCVRATIGDKYNCDIGGDLLRECFLYLAQNHQYDPVKRYLEKCRKCADPHDLDWVSEAFFGTTESLHTIYIRKWLIACVARVYDPGCKFDEALILQGQQGFAKTSFFEIMGGDWFTSSMTGKLDKDDLLVLSRNWICEWGELEGFTAKVYHGTIKHFLSKREDSFRIPYGRDVQRVPRRTVIVGTVNPETFLVDQTGNRRFWVVPVKREINTEELEKYRDSIWAAAVMRYFSGESWHLPRDLWQDQAEDNRNYEQCDPWRELLALYLETQEGLDVTAPELFRKLEEKGCKIGRTRGDQMRLAEVLKSLGWNQKRIWRGNKQIRVWEYQPVTTCANL